MDRTIGGTKKLIAEKQRGGKSDQGQEDDGMWLGLRHAHRMSGSRVMRRPKPVHGARSNDRRGLPD